MIEGAEIPGIGTIAGKVARGLSLVFMPVLAQRSSG